MLGGILHVRSPILYTPTVGRSQPKNKHKRERSLACSQPYPLQYSPNARLGSARTPIVFLPEDCVLNIAVRIVEGLPYGFILGARFVYANKSILNFGIDKGFKPTPTSPWVPFLDQSMTASNSPSSWDHFCAFSSMIHKDHMPNTLGPTPQSQ